MADSSSTTEQTARGTYKKPAMPTSNEDTYVNQDGYSNAEGYNNPESHDNVNNYTGTNNPGYPPSEMTYTQDAPPYQNMGPPQATTPQQMQQQPPQKNEAGEWQTFVQRFKVTGPKWNDLWAVGLLVCVLGGFIVVSGLSLHAYSSNKSFYGGGIYSSTGEQFSLNTNTVVLLSFVVVIALALSAGYFILARMFTKQFIWITGILNIVLGLATAIYYFAEHYYSAAIVFLIFAVFGALCFFSWIKRIPFATLVLQTVMDVAREHPSVLLTSLLGTLVASAFGAWFAVTVVAVYAKYNPTSDSGTCGSTAGGGCSHAKLIGLLIFVIFCGYYISEVIKNVVHTTIAGVYGSWYFCSRSTQGMPRWPALGAFRRSMTYSLGSISFGSLIVSIIQLLQQLAAWGQQAARGNGNVIGMAIICVLRGLIAILSWAVQYFNHYAYCYIALYGSAYIPAAKETWKLIKDRGIDALINDCLIDPVLSLGAQFVAYVCALFAYLYLRYTQPAYNSTGNYYAPCVGFAFVIGLQICNIASTPIKSGAATFFTAMARDPEVLRMSYPQLYNSIAQYYPRVLERIYS
ncbi:plasma-membrane choline transporter-domain-containing protein [Limtongia smithiae]|uniref:plasma-membrane choline transporter-domain-containing protein n=1 Tax=Limtongia smithiae TaxID=1125753 RepID=UPI0034CD28E7